MLLTETVNELDEDTYKFSSDQSLAALLTADHVVVETGGCYDDNQVYSLNTVYGVHDSATGNVRKRVKSISGAHGDVPISDEVTCDSVPLAEGEGLSGIVIYSDD